MLTLLQLYHYECGPQLGSWGLALPARCHIGLLWDEPKYENPVGATGHSMVSLDLPTGLSSPYGLFTWCPPKRSLWSLPYRHVLRHLGKLLGLPNLELTCLFGKILSFIGLSDFLMLTEAAHLLRLHLLCLDIRKNGHSNSQWVRWRYFCDTNHLFSLVCTLEITWFYSRGICFCRQDSSFQLSPVVAKPKKTSCINTLIH